MFVGSGRILEARRRGPPGQRQSALGLSPEQPKPRPYDRVVEVPRARRYSRRTEQAYIY